MPLVERKARLQALLADATDDPRLRYVEHFERGGDAVLRITDDLRRGGVSEEELERAKAPMLTSLKDAVRTNGYWLSSVLTQSTAHPQQLTWPLSILSDFQAVTSAEIGALAEKYLINDKAATAWVVPVPGTNGRK